jgi:hypothetical protein
MNGMAQRRFFYHPAILWLLMLTTLLPASLVTWGLFWRELSIRSGMALLAAFLLLVQGIIWASFIKLRHHKIDARNRSLWLRALMVSAITHSILFVVAVLASYAFTIFSTLFVAGPVLTACYMWMLVRKAALWQPRRPVPMPRGQRSWRSLPRRALALITDEKLPLPQPDDRQTLPTLLIALAIAMVTTALVSHGLVTNDLVLVGKRSIGHVKGYDAMPWAGAYIGLAVICVSCIAGHLDERPNAHIYRRFRNLMVWVVGFLLVMGLSVTFGHLVAALASLKT